MERDTILAFLSLWMRSIPAINDPRVVEGLEAQHRGKAAFHASVIRYLRLRILTKFCHRKLNSFRMPILRRAVARFKAMHCDRARFTMAFERLAKRVRATV